MWLDALQYFLDEIFTLDFIIPLLIILLFFLIVRGFNLWYWKVNEISKTLKEIADNTKKEKKEEKEKNNQPQ